MQGVTGFGRAVDPRWVLCTAVSLMAAGPVAAQSSFLFFGNDAEEQEDGLFVSFDPAGTTIQVERGNDPDRETRGIIEFATAGLPAGQVLVGAELTLTTIPGTGDPVFEFHGYSGDGTPSFGDGFDNPLDLTGRLQVPASVGSQTVDLDPGKIGAILDGGGQAAVFVRQGTDGGDASFQTFEAFNAPVLNLRYLNPAQGNQWVAGTGAWTTTSNWSQGFVPTATTNVFVQPNVNSTVSVPSGFGNARTLTIGGGTGAVEWVVPTGNGFVVQEQTTLLPNGAVSLDPNGILSTGGLNLAPGGTLDFGANGEVWVTNGFLSTPAGQDFIVDGSNLPLLWFRNNGMHYQPDGQTMIIGDAQEGRLWIDDNSEFRARRVTLGEQLTGRGDLQVDDNALADILILHIGPMGEGTGVVRDGARLEGAIVTVGSDVLGNFDGSTRSTFDVFGATTTVDLSSTLLTAGNAKTTVSNGSQVEVGTLSLYGDSTHVPEFVATGVGTNVVVSDRINMGLPGGGNPNGTGRLIVENGATLQTNLATVSLGLAPSGVDDNEIIVRGTGSELSIGASFFAGFFQGEARVTVTDDASLSVGETAFLGSSPTTVAHITLDNGAQWHQVGTMMLAGLRDPGTGDEADGGVATMTIDNGATLQADDELLLFAGADVTLNNGAVHANVIYDQRGGTFDFNGGTLSVNQYQGTLTQDGGTLAPGDSPGITQVTDDYVLNAGTLAIELGGPTPGADSDQVQVTGDVTVVSGGLELTLLDGFFPSIGDTFEIITAANVTGTFETVGGAFVDNQTGLAVIYEADGVTVRVARQGDLNFDGVVDGNDFGIFAGNFFDTPSGAIWTDGDLNGDGAINGNDFGIFAGNFDFAEASSVEIAAFEAFAASVPEPGGLVAGLLGFGLLGRRRVGRSA